MNSTKEYGGWTFNYVFVSCWNLRATKMFSTFPISFKKINLYKRTCGNIVDDSWVANTFIANTRANSCGVADIRNVYAFPEGGTLNDAYPTTSFSYKCRLFIIMLYLYKTVFISHETVLNENRAMFIKRTSFSFAGLQIHGNNNRN